MGLRTSQIPQLLGGNTGHLSQVPAQANCAGMMVQNHNPEPLQTWEHTWKLYSQAGIVAPEADVAENANTE